MDYPTLKRALIKTFEKEFLKNMLHEFEGNVTKTSIALEMDRSNFLKLCRKHRIIPENIRKVYCVQ